MVDGLVLGVDGGGSGCRAIVADVQGRILSVQTGRPCNYQNSNPGDTQFVLSELLKQTVEDLRVANPNVECAVFGMAGLDTDADAKILRQVVATALRDSGIDAQRVEVENDGIVTLYGFVGQGPGVLVLSGTGSIAWGVKPGSLPIRSGGWGHRLGDEGSGYAIGKNALLAVFHGHDGRGPVTGMESHILDVLGCTSISDVAEWAYSTGYSVSRIAGLAPTVLQLAKEGNPRAREVIARAADDLTSLITAVVNRLKLDTKFDMALYGGILENNPFLHNQIVERIVRHHPNCRLISNSFPSSLGATAYALRVCGADMVAATRTLQVDYRSICAPSDESDNTSALQKSLK